MRKLVLFFILIGVTACSMAPKRQKTVFDFTVPEQWLAQSSGQNGNKITPAFWWKEFNDDRLNTLIDRAIKNNLNLKVAIARVKAVEAQFDIAKRNQGPKMSAGASGAYGMYPKPGFAAAIDPATGQPSFQQKTTSESGPTYSLKMGLQFELDIWGRLYSMKQSALAQLFASQYELQGAFLTIIAQTATLYYTITALQREVKLSELTLKTFERGYEIEKERYSRGIGLKLNVTMARQNIEGARAQLESMKEMLALRQHQLATLVGEYPHDILDDQTDDLTHYLPPLSPIPAGLPADLMKNRPDLKSAEQTMEAARYQIGVAKADLFPKISLTAALGYFNLADIKNLFTSDYLTANAGVNIDYSFASGSKYAVLQQKRAIYEQTIYDYKRRVLDAFREVEDAMVQMESARRQQRYLRSQIKAAKESVELYTNRYQQGLAPYDKVLEFERLLFQSRSRLIDIEHNIMIARINFHRALGGNWLAR